MIALIGAELEENLSLRYLAASARAAGFVCEIYGLEVDPRTIVDRHPLVVGISVPFQTHARHLLGIAKRLRDLGYAGHIIVGGHFATFEYQAILENHPAIDSIARHEGEHTFVEVCQMVSRGERVGPIPGLVVRSPKSLMGKIAVGAKRPLPELDTLPTPVRPETPHDVLGVRAAPLVGSRGCYADCSFCCIYAYADNADGARYRMRTPESIAKEMREEYTQRGVRLFVFHDDNFFVPSKTKNLARYRKLKELIADLEGIGLVIKCRPNDVDRELFELLKSMGMIRAYVGIETNSDEGVVSLNRRITSEDNVRAMELMKELEVYCSFNVLIFDPEATIEGVERNLDFMQRFSDVPFNFCRAEVYAGTPLKSRLESQERLRGDWLAWNYEMRDPAVELLFRISMTAFHGRNFKSDGIANLNMGLRMDAEILRRFWPNAWDRDFQNGLTQLSRDIGMDSVARMRTALEFVRGDGDAKSFAIDLARGVTRADLQFLGRLKAIRREMESRVGKRMRHEYGVPWAAETRRLGSSVGTELSTEILPAPGAAE